MSLKPLILGAPTGDVYDVAGIMCDSHEALAIDSQIANASFDAGARIIPTGTYRVGYQLRTDKNSQTLTPELREMIQMVFRHKRRILSQFEKDHKIQSIINLHGVGTSPYRGPHDSVHKMQDYHANIIIECLNPIFPQRNTPLLYELIPTVEEACVVAHLCREHGWRVIISLYVKRDRQKNLCIQDQNGQLIPVVEALKHIEKIADTSNSWYAFNCFDPRLTGDLIELLEISHLRTRVRGIYPNLSDAENDPKYTPVWDSNTDSHIVSWNSSAESFPAFIGACCGSTPEHIRHLYVLLHNGQ